jgi:HAD superfamily hydrolase (TIGR01549 family)
MEGTRRWVCLDVGETLIDEARIWATWADVLGVPRPTFSVAFRSAVAGGHDHRAVLELFGGPSWAERAAEVEARYGGLRAEDLYPDAITSLAALHGAGYGTAVLANQPAVRAAQLEAIGVRPDVMAMSESLGVHKPDPAFYRRALELLDDPPPVAVAYVGDRLDNDVRPARAAGLRAVWLRRGPWGLLLEDRDEDAHLTVRSLDELLGRLPEVWPDDPV